jgi:hypothetical protein
MVLSPCRIRLGGEAGSAPARNTTRTKEGLVKPLILGVGLALAACAAAPARAQDIVVSDPSQLWGTLSDPSSAGKTIRLLAIDYPVTQPLVLREGATLVGAGVMTYHADGLPAGIDPDTRSRLLAAPTLVGDILTLRDGSKVAGVSIEDFMWTQELRARSSGNLLVVSSTQANDRITATIEECELQNPNGSGVAFNGPSGRGLVVITRNPREAVPPAPHTGASIAAVMRRSIIHSPGNGSCVFAINFAPEAQVSVSLERNVLGGTLDCDGGVSRPFTVTGSRTSIDSQGNLYQSDSADPNDNAGAGWQLTGGSGPPVSFLHVGTTSDTELDMHSVNDRLEGFWVGIYAVGGRRNFVSGISGPTNDCRTIIDMQGTRMTSIFVDVWLFGVESEAMDLDPGDHNMLHVSMRDVQSASVGVENLYGRAMGVDADGNFAPLDSPFDGTGNRLEGDLTPFARGN